MKKIIEFIFEDVPVDEYKTKESEEVVVEAPVVRHTFKEKPKTVNKVQENVEPVIKESTFKKPAKQVKTVGEVEEATETPRKSNFGIDLNNVPSKVEVNKPEIKRTTRTVQNKKNVGYVSQPNISPMFGLVSGENVTPVKKVDMRAKEETKAESASKIGTIFSPFYGVVEPKVETNNEIEKFPDINKISEVSETDETETNCVEENNQESFEETKTVKAVNNYDDINVDDIIAKPGDETYINAEEISLFDDLD